MKSILHLFSLFLAFTFSVFATKLITSNVLANNASAYNIVNYTYNFALDAGKDAFKEIYTVPHNLISAMIEFLCFRNIP